MQSASIFKAQKDPTTEEYLFLKAHLASVTFNVCECEAAQSSRSLFFPQFFPSPPGLGRAFSFACLAQVQTAA